MFPSYPVVTVFFFVILLNIVYMEIHLNNKPNTYQFKTCEECMNSSCHIEHNQTCYDKYKNTKLSKIVTCYTCETEDNEYYSKKDCKDNCPGNSNCTCIDNCYKCYPIDTKVDMRAACYVPDYANYPECDKVPCANDSTPAPAT